MMVMMMMMIETMIHVMIMIGDGYFCIYYVENNN